jgi:hypothetical protein
VKKLLLALMGLVAVVAPVVAMAAPADAATTTAPTMYAPNVARGHTIPVRINAHGSKVLSRSNTLWQGNHRIYDWSPKPGLYKVKSVIRYQTKTTTGKDVWVPNPDCADYSYEYESYDENVDGDYNDPGDWERDAYDACAPDHWGEYEWRTTVKYNASRLVTRYDYARVALDETPGCVSAAEYRLIKNGMTPAKVHSIFGTTGHVTTGGSMVTREYETCEGNSWSYVEVDYDPRVWFKWRYIDYDYS